MIVLAINLHELFLTLLGILFLLVGLVFVVIIVSFYKYNQFLRNRKWEVIIEDKIADAIITEVIDHTKNDEFSRLVSRKPFRDLCIMKLIETEKKFSGTVKTLIEQFYEIYQFDKDSYKKLTSKSAFLLARGIKELTSMNLREAAPRIEPFLHHKYPSVYQESQYAMVVFKGFDGLVFLDNLTKILSDWQQLRLLRSIDELPFDKIDRLREWLFSTNASVVVFALRLVSKFQIMVLYSYVIELLNHESEVVQLQSLKTLAALENERTLGDVLLVFDKKTLDVQLEIIRTIKSLHDAKSIPFLKSVLLGSDSITLKLAVAELLVESGELAFLTQKLQEESSSEELIKIINHSLQEKLC